MLVKKTPSAAPLSVSNINTQDAAGCNKQLTTIMKNVKKNIRQHTFKTGIDYTLFFSNSPVNLKMVQGHQNIYGYEWMKLNRVYYNTVLEITKIMRCKRQTSTTHIHAHTEK